MYLTRAGFLVRMISWPVLLGFVSSGGVLVVFTQLPRCGVGGGFVGCLE